MNLQSKSYREASARFRISQPADWQRITAADILAVDGCGRMFVNRLRMWLARRGLNLRGDNPAAYWLATLRPSDAGEIVGTCPFTIVVDTNETLPFSWETIRDRDGQLIRVETERRPMYRAGLADYTIAGLETEIQIERKGDDLPSSLIHRREEFETEIHRLSDTCQFAAVVVEHSWRDFLGGEYESQINPRSIHRTVLQWQISYPGVHWWFCEGRSHAENVTFRLLERFWWQWQRQRQQTEEAAA
jgi:hypothetical protein